ncbi:MAG TPA: carboxypeptidase-like regulatory domain-containing protein [Gemmatimonadaceae bacterium]
MAFTGMTLSTTAAAAQRMQSIEGSVVDSLGHPISFAYISTNAGSSGVAGVDGRFRFPVSIDARFIVVSARRIGFHPVSDTIQFNGAQSLPIRLTMRGIPTHLTDVEVKGTADGYDEYLDRSGYYRRVAKAIDGTFIDKAMIDKRNPAELTAMLTGVRGIRVERDYGKQGKSSYILGRGGICRLGLVVDGQFVATQGPSNEAIQPRIPAIIDRIRVPVTTPRGPPGVPIDETVPVDMIAAIEVYPSATSVPNEFHHHTDACGLIVVWTRYRK